MVFSLNYTLVWSVNEPINVTKSLRDPSYKESLVVDHWGGRDQGRKEEVEEEVGTKKKVWVLKTEIEEKNWGCNEETEYRIYRRRQNFETEIESLSNVHGRPM